MINTINRPINAELQELRTLLKELNCHAFNYDDFDIGEKYIDEDGLYHFGDLTIGKHTFVLKSSTSIMFEHETLLSKVFEELLPKRNSFSQVTLHVYECDTQFFESEFDFEPSITAIQVADILYIVGYFNGFEV